MPDAYPKHGPAHEKTLGFNRLTSRERKIVQLLAEGGSNKAVATLLGIGLNTVDTHRHAIMVNLDVHCVADLVRHAVKNHVIEA